VKDYSKGKASVPDPDEETLGPAMRALTPAQRRFAMAAVMFPLAKDWQIAKAAGYSDFSHGSLRVNAHRLFHDEKVLAAIKELGGQGNPRFGAARHCDDEEDRPDGRAQGSVEGGGGAGRAGRLHGRAEDQREPDGDRPDRAEMLERIRQLAAANGLDPAKLLGVNTAPVVDANSRR
jgi:hypothetical protein